jgi:uncharacterized Ntn-hydrolase superfamily protein
MEITNDREFYDRIYSDLEKIHSLPISFEEKRELEYLAYEVLQSYEKSKEPIRENVNAVEENINQLERALYKLKDAGIKRNSESARIANLNIQIAIAHINENVKKAGEIKLKKGIKVEKLESRIEAKRIAVEIISGMKKQDK